jgi:D-xylose transport system permease protein
MSAQGQHVTMIEEALPAAAEAPEVGARGWLTRLGEGELSSFRILIVLALIWAYFGLANSNFLTAANLTNLALQIAAVGTVSVGVVLVLLLGEIDLSVGAVSGMCAAIVAVLSATHGWNGYLAMLAGLLAGALVGLFQGTVITWLAIPSFVVTLAGFLGWAGVQLGVLGAQGTVNVSAASITNLADKFLAHWLGWVLAVLAVGALFGRALWARRQRAAAGLELRPLVNTLLRPVMASIAIIVAVAIVNQDRGVPVSLCILIGLVIIFEWLITSTPWGRHVLAVGGNEEAARRVGIPIARVKTVVFVLGSTLAAAGGILVLARLGSVDGTVGGGDFLLYAIAGPVIAGVSLFGGRGSVWGALLGALIIGSIQNGMDLLAYSASTEAIVTAAVLLVAVALDALARKARRRHGKA